MFQPVNVARRAASAAQRGSSAQRIAEFKDLLAADFITPDEHDLKHKAVLTIEYTFACNARVREDVLWESNRYPLQGVRISCMY